MKIRDEHDLDTHVLLSNRYLFGDKDHALSRQNGDVNARIASYADIWDTKQYDTCIHNAHVIDSDILSLIPPS
jgi:hypothetical protein